MLVNRRITISPYICVLISIIIISFLLAINIVKDDDFDGLDNNFSWLELFLLIACLVFLILAIF